MNYSRHEFIPDAAEPLYDDVIAVQAAVEKHRFD